MDVKRVLVFLMIAAMLILGLAACERSLSPSGGVTPPVAQPGEGQTSSAGSTEDVMQQIWMLATQTAMAKQGGQPTAQATPAATEAGGPAPVEPTATTAAVQPSQPTSPAPTEAALPTMAPVPTATPGLPRTYSLQSGEFPFCIARRFNVDVGELLRASGLNMNSRPPSGYTLTIPQTGHTFDGNRALRQHPDTHTVSSGESIYSIACLYGDVSPEAIAAANGLKSPYKLSSGQTLQIP